MHSEFFSGTGSDSQKKQKTDDKLKESTIKMPTIGVVGVTIPGAIDCIGKINKTASTYFKHHEHPNVVLHQLNFAPTHEAQNLGRWDIVENRLVESITALAKIGADFVIIPANTVHKVIDGVKKRSPLPILSILEIVADECERRALKKVGILGTRWTMQDHLYKNLLNSKNIAEVIPSAADQAIIQTAIFSELIPTGKATPETLQALLKIVANLKALGCDGIVLGCTELPLVLNDQNCGMPTLDSTNILAAGAVKKSYDLLTLNPAVSKEPTSH